MLQPWHPHLALRAILVMGNCCPRQDLVEDLFEDAVREPAAQFVQSHLHGVFLDVLQRRGHIFHIMKEQLIVEALNFMFFAPIVTSSQLHHVQIEAAFSNKSLREKLFQNLCHCKCKRFQNANNHQKGEPTYSHFLVTDVSSFWNKFWFVQWILFNPHHPHSALDVTQTVPTALSFFWNFFRYITNVFISVTLPLPSKAQASVVLLSSCIASSSALKSGSKFGSLESTRWGLSPSLDWEHTGWAISHSSLLLSRFRLSECDWASCFSIELGGFCGVEGLRVCGLEGLPKFGSPDEASSAAAGPTRLTKLWNQQSHSTTAFVWHGSDSDFGTKPCDCCSGSITSQGLSSQFPPELFSSDCKAPGGFSVYGTELCDCEDLVGGFWCGVEGLRVCGLASSAAPSAQGSQNSTTASVWDDSDFGTMPCDITPQGSSCRIRIDSLAWTTASSIWQRWPSLRYLSHRSLDIWAAVPF